MSLKSRQRCPSASRRYTSSSNRDRSSGRTTSRSSVRRVYCSTEHCLISRVREKLRKGEERNKERNRNEKGRNNETEEEGKERRIKDCQQKMIKNSLSPLSTIRMLFDCDRIWTSQRKLRAVRDIRCYIHWYTNIANRRR